MLPLKEKIFGDKKSFGITCQITSVEANYIFCIMSLYLNGNRICSNNMVSIINYMLGFIKDFFDKYDRDSYKSNVLSKILNDKVNIEKKINQIMKEYSEIVLEDLDTNIEYENSILSEIDDIFLDFEWESFSGCVFHFLQHNNKEWLILNNDKNAKYHVYELDKKIFYNAFKDFYSWSINTIETLELLQNNKEKGDNSTMSCPSVQTDFLTKK